VQMRGTIGTGDLSALAEIAQTLIGGGHGCAVRCHRLPSAPATRWRSWRHAGGSTAIHSRGPRSITPSLQALTRQEAPVAE
jgi:hypothetical protein